MFSYSDIISLWIPHLVILIPIHSVLLNLLHTQIPSIIIVFPNFISLRIVIY